MNSISEIELNKTEESLHEELPVPKKKRKRNLFIRIFLFFIGRFLHLLFLFLLFIRTPVLLFLKFLTAAGMSSVLLYGGAYLLGVEGISSIEIGIIITGAVLAILSLSVIWGYDALILRLAPPGYDIILFD
ncbi:hypothetical protein [Bartonella schoenbuchensis]|uniref:Uncharacterized protein n=2 Tax=Bartonella schoenbuchensis TaxID=165694 RepID=E6Z0R9_BARSR|nr:hypothetical protein [Bartonella schoenbuchensis]AQX31518.1 hypothetical protein BscR1v2_016150 [Bartonella schoenbuchensis R1]ENN90439.1 putative membrane protein [Bartonella schoenbuchensis m07a]CBI82707.1 membrane hypothetical protein [Bartonella schoenbuchensis R1]